MKTKKQMKQEWLDALRSGEYKQVKGTLKGITRDKDKGYCCLGVFASVVLGEEPPVCIFISDCGPDELYEEVEEKIGNRVYGKGINMNDNGKSFSEIADMIEKEWVV